MWPIANPFRKCELYHLSAHYLGRTGRGNAGGRYWDLSIALNIGFPDWYTGQAFFLKRFAEGSRCLLDAGGGGGIVLKRRRRRKHHVGVTARLGFGKLGFAKICPCLLPDFKAISSIHHGVDQHRSPKDTPIDSLVSLSKEPGSTSFHLSRKGTQTGCRRKGSQRDTESTGVDLGLIICPGSL